ncbi:MAG: hypothetical protein J1G04_00845 [Clostridiales bacterium]|nr:hypothetical protein [Clostridiales bacterium]
MINGRLKMLKDTILDFVRAERNLELNAQLRSRRELPENCFFLGDGKVLCYPRSSGDSRYPYACDGFTLWAHSSGNVSLNESTFYYILPVDDGKQPYAAFFGGVKTNAGYFPVSITGAAKQAQEKNIKRFMVYTPEAAYYIAKVKGAIYFVRAFVGNDKKAVFTVGAINTGKNSIETYLATHLNCLLMHAAGECNETKWFKKCTATEHGFVFESVENIDRMTRLVNYGVINRHVRAEHVNYFEHTCSRADFAGGVTSSITSSPALFSGHFDRQKSVCKFGETAAAGDMLGVNIQAGDVAYLDYVLEASFETCGTVRAVDKDYAENALDALIRSDDNRARSKTALSMKFGEFGEKLNGETFTEFIANVVRQVGFCALAKNSGISLLGVRDVVQQIEAALVWRPEECRTKLIELFGFIDPSGRAPRQYSLPAKGALPQMDTREFIDQNVWIISAIYTYLSYTDDYSILNEVCGYYKIVGRNRVESVETRDTIAEHLKRIVGYMLNNIDEETGCLRILYGDWNDAVDGLGVSRDPDKEYGSGVSVMASLQLYKNLDELLQISEHVGIDLGDRQRLTTARERLLRGLQEHAIVSKDGARKILHGWGDGKSYTVGGFDDPDGMSRDGLTANAFWVISGAYLLDKSIKKDILDSFSRLDSKYGLKTFAPHFDSDAKGVGRIVDLPPGTAENGAVYVHATMFGIWSLFLLGEGKKAWEQLFKVLPLTHSLITTTPFIMSNSYCYNEELGLDGESMSDWFTGSSNALVKALVKYVFGIIPDLNGVAISPSEYMPMNSAEIHLTAKGKRIDLFYRKTDRGARTFILNGKAVSPVPDKSSGAPSLYIATNDLADKNVIVVED